MNIQPINALKLSSNTKALQKRPEASPVSFKGEENKIDNAKLANALKAFSVATAVAFSPAVMTSCDKDHICDEYCDHPNHIDPPNWGQNDSIKNDTVKTGINYKLPAVSMKRYQIHNGDTIGIGNIKFSESIVHIPNNAHKSSELKTYMKFIEAMGLNTTTAKDEYVPTRSFAYNAVPAQVTWLDEKSGAVTQLKLNGFEKDKNKIQMDLISILANDKVEERKIEITSVGSNKLILNSFTKDGSQKIGSTLLSMDNGVITHFKANDDGTYTRNFEYSKGSANSIIVMNKNGEKSKIANIHTIIALAPETDED